MTSLDPAAALDFVLGGFAICSLVAGEVLRRWRRAGPARADGRETGPDPAPGAPRGS